MIDFADIRGQEPAIDALVDALIRGEPGVLLEGPPGAGRFMFGRRISTILPALMEHERRWIEAEYTSMGVTPSERPHRAPHHTISTTALVGGYSPASATPVECLDVPQLRTYCRCRRAAPAHVFHSLPVDVVPRSGELQLARFGVLTLDELPEFPSRTIRTLSSALRRMHGRPFIVATTNPCPCGWRNMPSLGKACSCSDAAVERFGAVVRDAIAMLDIRTTIPVPSRTLPDMRELPPGPSSAELRDRIARARAVE